MLLRAYQVYEEETGQHGQPLYLSRSTDPNIVWDIEERIDGAQAALDAYDEQMKKMKSPPKGLNRYPVPRHHGGLELEGGLARERIFKESVNTTVTDELASELLEQGLIEVRPPQGYDPREYGDALVESAQTG